MADYRQHWESTYQEAYASGKGHWRAEHATPRAFLAFMESAWAPRQGARILEAGCSDGLNAVHLARRGYEVTGVDVSETAIARARETAADAGVGVAFVCLDLARDAVPGGGCYDLWIDIKTLHCLWRDEDRQRYLAGVATALGPSGVLFLNCGLALADVRAHFPLVFAALDAETRGQADVLDRELPPEQWMGIRCETLEWYCDELKQAGLTICASRREASIEAGWGAVVVAKREH